MIGLARSELDLDGARRAARRRGEGAADGAARARRVDRRLVPRPAPRAARTPGRGATSPCARRCAALYGDVDVREAGDRFHPFENLTRPLPPARPAHPVIRQATADDLPLVRELWRAFEAEIPDARVARLRHDEDARGARRRLCRDGIVLVAEDDGGRPVASRRRPRSARVPRHRLRPAGRARQGIAAELVRGACVAAARGRRRDARARGARVERGARSASTRAGASQPVELTLAAPLDELEKRLAAADRADVRLRPRPDRRRRRRSKRRCARCCRGSARPSEQRHRAAQRLGRRPRRAVRPRSRAACGAREGALVRPAGGRARDRRRARRGRPVRRSSTAAATSTSTRRCPSTSARCRPAT